MCSLPKTLQQRFVSTLFNNEKYINYTSIIFSQINDKPAE